MPRKPRTPGQPAIRLTAYVTQRTFDLLHDRAKNSGVSLGALLDSIMVDDEHPGWQPPAPIKPAEPLAALPEAFIDHPGWRLNSIGQNVCTKCGKRKNTHRNQSCIP